MLALIIVTRKAAYARPATEVLVGVWLIQHSAQIIASMPGCISHELPRCLEKLDRYILLVRWERMEDQTEGFRKSTQYLDWKRLLALFLYPLPVLQLPLPRFHVHHTHAT